MACNVKVRWQGSDVVKIYELFRELNNRLTGWAFAHLVNNFAHPVN